MNPDLLHTEAQDFINAHLKADLPNLVLKGSPFSHISIQDLAEQILSKSKSKAKLPTWYQTNEIYYPPPINIEQTSSEITAKYKAEFVSGKSLIDLTGGLGVDSLYFSKRVKHITHCEINQNLSEIVAYNADKLGVKNISFKNQDGISLLQNSKSNFDWIYIDPSRRNEEKSKVFKLEDCSPNVISHLMTFLEHTENLMIKLSPFLDISVIIHSLNFVREIHIVAVKNEVKELLVFIENGFKKSCTIKAVNLIDDRKDIFTGSFPSMAEANLSELQNYLYEPNSAILKSGLFNEVSHQFNVSKININSHLYTSRKLIDFHGRRFEILNISAYNKKQIKKEFGSKKANITVRNFHESVQQIRKKTGIKEGGNDYLFFTTDMHNKAIMIHCIKV